VPARGTNTCSNDRPKPAGASNICTAAHPRDFPALGGKLPNVISFSPVAQIDAVEGSRKALERRRIESNDARELLAMARRAFVTNPAKFNSEAVAFRIMEQVKTSQASGPRAAPRHTGKESLAALERTDRAAGAVLLGKISPALAKG
jgi:hypothetical protein